jgi:hypothetical protein
MNFRQEFMLDGQHILCVGGINDHQGPLSLGFHNTALAQCKCDPIDEGAYLTALLREVQAALDRNHPLSRKLRPFRRVILGAQRAETKIIDSHADAVTPVHNTANAHTRSAHKRKIVHQPNLKTILKKSERVFVSRVYRYYCPLQYSILLCISYKYRS